MTAHKSRKPMDLEGGSAGQKDKIHAATSIQSIVTPEDYPTEEREAETQVATGRTCRK